MRGLVTGGERQCKQWLAAGKPASNETPDIAIVKIASHPEAQHNSHWRHW